LISYHKLNVHPYVVPQSQLFFSRGRANKKEAPKKSTEYTLYVPSVSKYNVCIFEHHSKDIGLSSKRYRIRPLFGLQYYTVHSVIPTIHTRIHKRRLVLTARSRMMRKCQRLPCSTHIHTYTHTHKHTHIFRFFYSPSTASTAQPVPKPTPYNT
jgi:hypothetical protein